MFPYVLLIGFSALADVVARKYYLDKNRSVKVVISVFFIIFVLILAFRGPYIGNDTIGYKNMFDESKDIAWNNIFIENKEIEYGYKFLEKVLSSIFSDYQWLLVFVAICSVVPLYLYYRTESEIPILTIALFITVAPFSMYFSGIRQALAMAFAMPAFSLAKNKKPLLFILTIFLANLFHKSALILILLYPICSFRITKKSLWFILPIMVTILIFNKHIFLFLLNYINDFYGGEITETGAYTTLLLLIVFAIYSYVAPDESKMDNETLLLRNILLLSICIQSFAPLHFLAMRINYYYLLFIPVLLPKIACRSKLKDKKIIRISVIVLTVVLITYFYINLLSGGGLMIYPYVPFWS